MISLKKYLDSSQAVLETPIEPENGAVLPAAMAAYSSVLSDMADTAIEVCPGPGDELKQRLAKVRASLSPHMSPAELASTGSGVREQLRNWGRRTAQHYQQKASEVKDLLIVMARTAESVGARDRRCAGQMNEVTRRLKEIASLDDLTLIRGAIERSAGELRSSIDRMTLEGTAAIQQLQHQVTTYQAKLEEAEELALRDGLTGARSRFGVESLIESRIASGKTFSVAMVDIDDFKKVNDHHGHMIGDEVLKQFAAELRSVCRPTDVIGRWGGDEFIIIFDGTLSEARNQKNRIGEWACGNYSVPGKSGAVRLAVNASIGVAQHQRGESLKELLGRADAAMYAHKAEVAKASAANR